MPPADRAGGWRRAARAWRVAWAATSLLIVESVVVGLALAPAAGLVEWSASWTVAPAWLRVVLRSLVAGPAYVAFALALTVLSPAATRLLRWRTPRDVEMKIADMSWPLLTWVRYIASAHVVRLCAGVVLRASPIWTSYHRWNGARLGRGVYVNSLAIMDDNLLEFGDRVVIGAGVHLSGHTVERGVVKTGAVRVGSDVTIGVGAVVGIGVEIGSGTQVGALSVVPKHWRLEPGARYAGAPVRRLDEPVPVSLPASSVTPAD